MTTEERLLRLENAFATLAEMHAQAETRSDALLQIVRDHDDRLETQQGWINQLGATQARLTDAQANSEAKIAALADAQIHTEEAIARLTQRLDALIERLDRDGQP